MCKLSFNGFEKYEYHSSISNTTLYVCKKCAVREYYGTKSQASKKWKSDKSNNKLFGEPINNKRIR
tara:strand:+ start:1585 stop:1782 length:198 start_codon:yes stop_codon:yes gene_type:complete